MVSMSMLTLFATQFNHALKTRIIIYVHIYKEDIFVDVFVNIQDNISVIISSVNFP